MFCQAIDNDSPSNKSTPGDVESCADEPFENTNVERSDAASESYSNGASIDSSGIEENGSIHVEENPPSAPLPTVEPSLPGDYLPVASPVETRTERLERRRVLQEQRNRDIPHATPQDLDAENKRRRRHMLWIVSAVLMALLVVVGIVVGVTVGLDDDTTPQSEPTPSPTSEHWESLQQLFQSVSFDGGAALNDTDSPQSRALSWLDENANLNDYPEWKRIQRYALAVFYYSTRGEKWRESTGWLSDDDECTWWLTHEPNTPICNQDGAYINISLNKNNLNGSLPLELALLSDSLGKLHSSN
jgi:hypothetical protein